MPKTQEVYYVENGVDDFCGVNHLKKFRTYCTKEGTYKTTYYQTYGGGPEGGYFLRTFYPLDNDAEPINELYSVNRTWGTAFTAELVDGVLYYNKHGDGTAGTCHVVLRNNNNNSDDEDDEDDTYTTNKKEIIRKIIELKEANKIAPPKIECANG
jgi:hypothetical protein